MQQVTTHVPLTRRKMLRLRAPSFSFSSSAARSCFIAWYESKVFGTILVSSSRCSRRASKRVPPVASFSAQKINYMSEYSVILRSKYNIKIQKSIHPYLMLCDYKLKVPRFRALQWYNNMMRWAESDLREVDVAVAKRIVATAAIPVIDFHVQDGCIEVLKRWELKSLVPHCTK